MRCLHLATLALVLVLSPSSALADLTLGLETRSLGSDAGEMETVTLSLKDNKFATDDVQANGPATKTIFDRDSRRMWYIEHDSKSYVTLDEEGFRNMAVQFDAAIQQMQKQLESMPPEQRKQVEEMMKAQMPGMDPQKHTLDVVATDKRETITGKPCTIYEVHVDGEKISEVWATSWKDAGVPKKSLGMLYDITAFFESLASTSPKLGEALAAEGGFMKGLDQIDGFPLRILDYREGQPRSETLVKTISQDPIAAEHFQVPAGYTMKSFEDD